MVVHGKDPSILTECWGSSEGSEGARVTQWTGGSRMPYVLVKREVVHWNFRVRRGVNLGDRRYQAEI